MPTCTLSDLEWKERAVEHRERAEGHTLATRKRRDHGHPHPIEDFLFQYYPYPFTLLELWQPGCGVGLEWIDDDSSSTLLRLPQTEIDALVESWAICCSHHDAFRFFAMEARPLNRLQPTLEGRVGLEQFGCVHANMDLYKWTAKAMLWIGSELLLDCFELAMELRDLDMRASLGRCFSRALPCTRK